MRSTAKESVLSFIDAINPGDVSRIAGLMSHDHTFVDSGDTVDSDRESLINGWGEYFRMFPDYRIEMPGAWKAVFEKGRIKRWQVYADWTRGVKISEQAGITGAKKNDFLMVDTVMPKEMSFPVP